MQLFEPWWSVFGGWLSWFFGRQLANKWLCTTQNWLFCVILVVQLRHVHFFFKNRLSFAWKCFMREQLLLDLAHLETTIQSTVVYLRAHIRKSTIGHLSWSHRRVSKQRDRMHFFRPIDTSLFLSDWQIVWIPMRTNFFDSQMFMQYWMYAGLNNA